MTTQSKGRGRGRDRKGSGGFISGRLWQGSHHLNGDASEDMDERLQTAKQREAAAIAEEVNLRRDLLAAEATFSQLQKREARARDLALDASKAVARKHAFARSEMDGLAQRIVELEHEAKRHDDHVELWRSELDDLVLQQANAMQHRDQVVVETKKLQEEYTREKASADEIDAQIKLLEDGLNDGTYGALRKEMEAAKSAKVEAEAALEAARRSQIPVASKCEGEEADVWMPIAASLSVGALALGIRWALQV